MYISNFETALRNFKNNSQRLQKEFELFWLGVSSKYMYVCREFCEI